MQIRMIVSIFLSNIDNHKLIKEVGTYHIVPMIFLFVIFLPNNKLPPLQIIILIIVIIMHKIQMRTLLILENQHFSNNIGRVNYQ